MLITVLIVIQVTEQPAVCWETRGPIWATGSAWRGGEGGSVSYGMVLIVAVWLGIQINSPDQMLLFCILLSNNTLYILLLLREVRAQPPNLVNLSGAENFRSASLSSRDYVTYKNRSLLVINYHLLLA